MKSTQYVVTTSIGGLSRSRIWDPEAPLPIGHPFRWVLEQTSSGIRIRDLSAQPGRSYAGEVFQIPTKALEQGDPIRVKSVVFRIRRVGSGSTKAIPALPILRDTVLNPGESGIFTKALGVSLTSFLAISLAMHFWPKPQTEELIPPQFAKILLTKPKGPARAESSGGGKSSGAKVAKALKSKTVQNAIAKFLTQSRLLASVATANAAGTKGQKLFDTKSPLLAAVNMNSGVLDSRNSAVGTSGGSGGDGKTPGYGKGERAGVEGQGQGLVSLDIGGSSVEEGLTKDEVGAVIHRHMSEVRYCYESAMIRTPDVEGKLIVNFTIGGGGNVKTTAVNSSTLPDPRLDECILRRLATWQFPKPKGGIDVAVSYPFVFKTLER